MQNLLSTVLLALVVLAQIYMVSCQVTLCDSAGCTNGGTCLTSSPAAVCSCRPGFRLNLATLIACDDIDECAANPFICGTVYTVTSSGQVGEVVPRATCTNTVGSFFCGCTSTDRGNAASTTCAERRVVNVQPTYNPTPFNQIPYYYYNYYYGGGDWFD